MTVKKSLGRGVEQLLTAAAFKKGISRQAGSEWMKNKTLKENLKSRIKLATTSMERKMRAEEEEEKRKKEEGQYNGKVR